MIRWWEDALGYPTIFTGDTNIDRLVANDPDRRSDIKNLIPILTDFQQSNNVILVNKKPTRFRQN